jgi:D-alanyl-D-alanine carboxypeptidase
MLLDATAAQSPAKAPAKPAAEGAAPADQGPVEPSRLHGPYIVADAQTGQVYDHHDAVRPWFPASTTKLMTLYVVLRSIAAGELTLESPVTVSKNAAGQPPSKMGFRAGTMLTLDSALKMMMVKSANDIAVAVAETVGGSVPGFAERMNAEAKRLGMMRSQFVNPHGLPEPRQISSARDMAVLARALLTDFPEHRGFLNIHAIQFGKTIMRTYNPLLERYQGATGMKTGFICASGYNLVASAQRGGRELIAVVFGAYGGAARAEEAAGLLNAAFVAAGVQPPAAAAPAAAGDAQLFTAGQTITEGDLAAADPQAGEQDARLQSAASGEPAAALAQPAASAAPAPAPADVGAISTRIVEGHLDGAAQPLQVSLTLASVDSGAQFAEPFDMRPLVCAPRKASAASEANTDQDPTAPEQVSNLSAPVYLGPPVQVAVISQADPNARPGQPGYVPRIPPPRPALPTDQLTSGVADAYAPQTGGGDGATSPEQAIAR